MSRLPEWVKVVEAGEFRVNTYVLVHSGEALVIDPAAPAEELLRLVGGARPVGLLITHPHFDHMLTLAEAKKAFGAPLLAPRGAEEALREPDLNLSLYSDEPFEAPEPDRVLEEGDRVRVGGLELEVLLTPGHSPGSACYLERSGRVAFTGDLLFAESVGRTDLPGGDDRELARSLLKLLGKIDDSWLILPGHGPWASLGEVKALNPLLWDYVGKLKGF